MTDPGYQHPEDPELTLAKKQAADQVAKAHKGRSRLPTGKKIEAAIEKERAALATAAAPEFAPRVDYTKSRNLPAVRSHAIWSPEVNRLWLSAARFQQAGVTIEAAATAIGVSPSVISDLWATPAYIVFAADLKDTLGPGLAHRDDIDARIDAAFSEAVDSALYYARLRPETFIETYCMDEQIKPGVRANLVAAMVSACGRSAVTAARILAGMAGRDGRESKTVHEVRKITAILSPRDSHRLIEGLMKRGA